MSTTVKILSASLIAFVAGFGSGRLPAPAAMVADPGLEWQQEGEAVRLTAESMPGFLVYQRHRPEADPEAGRVIAPSGLFYPDQDHPVTVFVPVLICDSPACEPCGVSKSCEIPPTPPGPPGIEGLRADDLSAMVKWLVPKPF